MEKTFNFTVNGQPRSVSTDPDRPLLDVLREDLELVGTKYGCGEGKCRACTVLMGGKSIASCITSIARAERQTILTIEGLASGNNLHPVQAAFVAEGAMQCGYCTPGMIMGAVSLLQEKPHPTEAEIKSSMEGHLCRCCGYPKIIKAIKRAAGVTK